MVEFSFLVGAIMTIGIITAINSFTATSFLGHCLQVMFNALIIMAILGALAIGASSSNNKNKK